MIVTLLTAPRLVKPLTHKLLCQLLRHGLAHTHDPVTEHFADGLVLSQPTHLTAHEMVMTADTPTEACKHNSISSWPSLADITSLKLLCLSNSGCGPLKRQSCYSTMCANLSLRVTGVGQSSLNQL